MTLITGGIEKNVYLDQDAGNPGRNSPGFGFQNVWPIINQLLDPPKGNMITPTVPPDFFAPNTGRAPLPLYGPPQVVPLKTPEQGVFEQEQYKKAIKAPSKAKNLLLLLLLGGLGYYAYKQGGG